MININVVGSIHDNDELSEIETIAKVFVVEQRLNDITFNLKNEKNITNPSITSQRKKYNQKNSYNVKLSLLNVRGFV